MSGLNGRSRGLRRLPIEIDAGHCSLGALEDDVLGLLHVEVRLAKLFEHMRQHARPIAVPDDEHVRGRGPLRQIHDVRNSAGFEKGLDHPDRLGGDGVLCLIGRCPDVMRSDDIG